MFGDKYSISEKRDWKMPKFLGRWPQKSPNASAPRRPGPRRRARLELPAALALRRAVGLQAAPARPAGAVSARAAAPAGATFVYAVDSAGLLRLRLWGYLGDRCNDCPRRRPRRVELN